MSKETKIKYEENPVLTSGEVQAVAILGLEGMTVNAYDIYLCNGLINLESFWRLVKLIRSP